MREIQASEAKAHLASLLDEVERGETVVITRHAHRADRARSASAAGGNRSRHRRDRGISQDNAAHFG